MDEKKIDASEATSIRKRDNDSNRQFWDSLEQSVRDWDANQPSWLKERREADARRERAAGERIRRRA